MKQFFNSLAPYFEKLENSQIFWLGALVVISAVVIRVAPHYLTYKNKRLETERKWDHNDRRLQGQIESRRQKANRRAQKDGTNR